MKRLTPQAQRTVSALYAEVKGTQKRFYEGGGGDVVRLTQLLQELEAYGEVGAVRSLLPLALISNSQGQRQQIAATITALLALVPINAWPQWGEAFRRRYYFSEERAWFELTPQWVTQTVTWGAWAYPFWVMASFHNYGFIREVATRALAQEGDGRELPFLLIRANDWVPQVRVVAQQALTERLTPAYASHFLEALPLVWRLQSWQRANHRPLVKQILTLVCRTVGEDLLQGLGADDRERQRVTLAVVLAFAEPALQAQAVQMGLRQKRDVFIRMRCADVMAEVLAPETLRPLLPPLLRDSFMPVRRAALLALLAQDADGAEAVLRPALLDKHISMRELARFHLRQRAPMDFAAFYRALLEEGDDGPHLYVAISGLGETGTAVDADYVLFFGDASQAKIRLAVVRALAKLDAAGQAEVLLMMLSDEAAKVAHSAMHALRRTRAFVPHEALLWQLFQAAAQPHTQPYALALLAQLPKWQSSYYLLYIMGLPDEVMAAKARVYLQRWHAYNRSFVQPTVAQVARIRGLYNQADVMFSEADKAFMERVLTKDW